MMADLCDQQLQLLLSMMPTEGKEGGLARALGDLHH